MPRKRKSRDNSAQLPRQTIRSITSIYREKPHGKRRKSPVTEAVLMGTFYGSILTAVVAMWAIDATGSLVPFLISLAATCYMGIFIGVNGHILNRRIMKEYLRDCNRGKTAGTAHHKKEVA